MIQPGEEPKNDVSESSFNNEGVNIIEIDLEEGEVDYTERPMRESLRKIAFPGNIPPEATNQP